jgi:hypothetical protein
MKRPQVDGGGLVGELCLALAVLVSAVVSVLSILRPPRRHDDSQETL